MGKSLGRKCMALLLALTMVLSGAAFAFADDAQGAAKATGTPDVQTAKDAADAQETSIPEGWTPADGARAATVAAPAAAQKSYIPTLAELKGMKLPKAPEAKPAVMLNGEYIAFTDAAPANIKGRVMVPFRAILEAMGATVNYDTKTKEITAALDGKTISFYAGKSALVVTENGKNTTITMDVVPFIDKTSQRTYVSSRFVAEAFGYSVGWDQDAKTVILIDFMPIIKEATEKFSILGMLCENSEIDVTKPYKTSGDFTAKMTFGTEMMAALTGAANAKAGTIDMKGTIDGVAQGMTAEMGMVIDVNAEDFFNALALTDEDSQLLESILGNLSMDIKMDEENIYIKMPLLDTLMVGTTGAPATGQEVWYKMSLEDVFAVYEEMGINLSGLAGLGGVMSFEDLLVFLTDAFEDSMTIETYAGTQAVASVLNEVIGDKAFKTTGTGSVKTHTATLDADKIVAIAKSVGESEAAETALAELKKGGVDFSLDLTVREKDGKLSDYTMKLTFSVKSGETGGDDLTMTIDASGSARAAKMSMGMKIGNLLDFTMQVNEKIGAQTAAPNLKVPDNAKIVDFSQMMAE